MQTFSLGMERQHAATQRALLTKVDDLAKLSHVEGVRQAMAHYGAGPFMMLASSRIELDVEAIARKLNVNHEEATRILATYLNGQQPEHQPAD